ncbi:DUF2871 domain-containing protein [Senegalia massiliensis]|uniref:DUF2871 domain-containing protein n=1 Tax=Senegalia massiliensis TaxID=1720316 RepID=A0A845R456_9CLOT|nr:DUF2871 domain-containing protein [Senegalia massiliensis]NBI07283.1 DUF2871 domain-containing protein [Senegalia massiliensis]
MNKYIKIAIYYAVLGLISGVFYREFTKFNGVDGGTSLAYLHVHILTLGMFFFMILSLFESKLNMSNFKGFKLFNITYNLGLHITLGVFIVRGVTEVLGSNYSRAFDKSISGIAGIGHILLATGIITILIILNKSSKKLEVYNQ